jgi:hypothetical protein
MGILFMFRFHWPFGPQAVLSVTKRISSLGVAGVSCFTSVSYANGLLMSTFAFVALAIAFALFVVAVFMADRVPRHDRFVRVCFPATVRGLGDWLVAHEYNRSVPRALYFMFKLTFPGMVQAGLSHFQCVHVDGKDWVRVDMSQQCWSPQHDANTVVAVVALVQAVVVPVALVFVLWLSDPTSASHDTYLGMLTQNYHENAWFCEPLHLLRKAAFVCVAVLIEAPAVQAFGAATLMMLSGFITVALKPYIKDVKWIALLDSAGHFVLILCVLIGVTWFGPGSDQSDTTAASVAGVVVVVAVVGFALVLVGLTVYVEDNQWAVEYCIGCTMACRACCKASAQQEEEAEEEDGEGSLQQDGLCRTLSSKFGDVQLHDFAGGVAAEGEEINDGRGALADMPDAPEQPQKP